MSAEKFTCFLIATIAHNQPEFLRKSFHNKFYNFQSICDDFNIPISDKFETYYLPVLAIGCIDCSLINKTVNKYEGALGKNKVKIKEDFRKLLQGIEKESINYPSTLALIQKMFPKLVLTYR